MTSGRQLRRQTGRRLGRRLNRGLGWGIVLLALVAAGGCGNRGTEKGVRPKLLIIGIDSADWSLLDPMLEQGRMPQLQAFRAVSCSGKMLSFRPLEKSPILWASICTGLPPDKHGVGGFVEGRSQRPVRSSAWRAPALWDIAGAAGLSTAVIGMWATYPARDIDGVMVSDFLPYSVGHGSKQEGLITPDSLQAIIAAMNMDPSAVPAEELTRFLPEGQLDRAEREYPQEMQELRAIYAGDRTYFEVARWLMSYRPFDIFFFYLRGPDMISHKFWRFFEPEKSWMELTDDEKELFGQVVPRYYEWVDEVVGQVLQWFPPEYQVVILSDHGFHGPRKSERGVELGTQEHNPFGIFLVKSPLYQAGSTFDRLELLDVGPTLLALLGLPASQEMTGHVLAEDLTPSGSKRIRNLETHRLPSYQSLAPSGMGEAVGDTTMDKQIRQRLRSLGYIN